MGRYTRGGKKGMAGIVVVRLELGKGKSEREREKDAFRFFSDALFLYCFLSFGSVFFARCCFATRCCDMVDG